ncbi:biotin/lipoyl-containing protein [Atopobacter phocae]|uniref:biotin/lipoyl-containing protein n=1 Tax=Atopobacter phocae TaxID=136492 RepID=UPI00047294AD|nr:biotin/lipoyl-containing protein [Atopobacter phocae]
MKKYEVNVDGKVYQVTLKEVDAFEQAPAAPTPAATPAPAPASSGSGVTVNAPMAGNVLNVLVTAGQQVKQGDTLVLLEAMKMENEIIAPQDGVVSAVHVAKGQTVESNELLVTL